MALNFVDDPHFSGSSSTYLLMLSNYTFKVCKLFSDIRATYTYVAAIEARSRTYNSVLE